MSTEKIGSGWCPISICISSEEKGSLSDILHSVAQDVSLFDFCFIGNTGYAVRFVPDWKNLVRSLTCASSGRHVSLIEMSNVRWDKSREARDESKFLLDVLDKLNDRLLTKIDDFLSAEKLLIPSEFLARKINLLLACLVCDTLDGSLDDLLQSHKLQCQTVWHDRDNESKA